MNDLYEFETSMGEDGGAAPEVDDTPEVEAQPEPESPWSPSQDEWQRVTGFMQSAAPVLEALAQQYQQQQQEYDPYQQQQPYQQYQPEEEFDPFDAESVQNFIQAQIQQGLQAGLQQTLGPYQGLMGIMASQHGEQLARTELDSIKSELGGFDEDAAFLVASGLIEQGGDPTLALRQSAQYAQEWEKRIRDDERSKYKDELQNLQGAPRDTPVGGASAANEQGVPTGQGRYEEAIRRALSNRQPSFPVG